MPSSMPRPARRIGTTSGLGVDSRTPVVGRDRGHDVDRLGAHVPGGLVGEQGDQLVGEPPEGGGVGALVAQRGELVRDQRVVDDVDPHGQNLCGKRGLEGSPEVCHSGGCGGTV